MRKQILMASLTGVLLLSMTACAAKTTPDAVSSATETTEAAASSAAQTTQAAVSPASQTTGGASVKNLNKGKQAPDFEMMDQHGNKVRLSDFKGQKVYIKYWASWCPICLGGLEDINTLSAENNGFKVLTIVAPGQKGEKNVEDFKTWFSGVDNTKNITVLFDTDGAYGVKAGVRGYPTSEYIGSDGVLVKIVPGHADNNTIIDTFKTIK